MKKLLKPTEAIIIIVAAVICMVWLLLPRQAADTAVITWTNSNMHTESVYIPLDKDGTYTMNDLFDTPFSDTLPDMTFIVSEHDIRVQSSDCPGQNCVHMGSIGQNFGTVICVPNRVVIHEKRVSDKTSEFDAVV
jgi:hypothetical protein